MDMDKIERIKDKAEVFLTNNIKAFIRDIDDTYYFCDIMFVGEIYLILFDFKRKERFKLYWQDVMDFKEYEVRHEK